MYSACGGGAWNNLSSPDWQPMLEVLASENPGSGELATYRSPAWRWRALPVMRTVTAFELHPTGAKTLASWAEYGVRVVQQDGLKGLLQKLPPPPAPAC